MALSSTVHMPVWHGLSCHKSQMVLQKMRNVDWARRLGRGIANSQENSIMVIKSSFRGGKGDDHSAIDRKEKKKNRKKKGG